MERFQQIEEIFHQALHHEPTQREAYVRQACRGDSDLRREVVSLLATHDEGAGCEPWPARAAAQLIDSPTSLQPGQTLGPYRIDSFLAAGGMGEVYRATDTRLDRQVAIKVSTTNFSERFEREARVIASLNHPNICTLYDVGPNYLVMEYVEGATLAERIEQGSIPLPDALSIARQMAAALEEAHQRLIVHRDFKPGNVKIKPDGTVKVLDFGLAKMPPTAAGSGANAIDSPTLTIAATQPGVLLGTVAYMSPEQARGEPVDRRGDVWAFGAVLWEMLTGRHLFHGKTTSDLLAAVIRDQPDLNQVPAKVRPLLKRCLEKDPQKRLRDIGDAMGIIESTPESTPESTEVRRTWLPWGIVALMLLALAAVSFVHFRENQPEARPMITMIDAPENTSFDFSFDPGPPALVGTPALSPDGRSIVFKARGKDGNVQLWMRPLDSLSAQALAGTEGALDPFWSPDSRSVAFFAEGKLKRMEISGGPAVTIADAPTPYGGSWSPAGVIVFAPRPDGPLQRVPEHGGTPTAVTKLEPGQENLQFFPFFLPDGRHFLFTSKAHLAGDPILRVGALDSWELKTVGPINNINAAYSSGYLLFRRESALMAQPFDEERLITTGGAVPVSGRIWSSTPDSTLSVAMFSVAREGLLAYHAEDADGQQLTWFDRSGKPVGTLGDPGAFWSVDFSPDRKYVAVSLRGKNDDVWIYEVARGLARRFTFSPAAERDPVWSPDGRSLIYFSDDNGPWNLYRKAADGTGRAQLLSADGARKVPTDWSPDGKFLLYFRFDPGTSANAIWVLPIETVAGPGGASKAFRWSNTPFREHEAKFSPDGHWVAFQSNESGRFEIYVAPFSGPGGRRQISNGGGSYPRWRADGKEIFYERNGILMAAEVSIKSGNVEAGAIHSLGIPVEAPHYRYDVSNDGQRFLVAAPQNQKSPALTLVQNWTALLEKK